MPNPCICKLVSALFRVGVFIFFSVQNCETIVWQGTTFPLRFRFRISTSVLNKCETMPAIDLVFAGENNGINGNLCAAKLMTFLQGFFRNMFFLHRYKYMNYGK